MAGELERLLDRTSLRLALKSRLARAAWIGLGSFVSLELGVLAARGVGSFALGLGEVTAALLGLVTIAALFRGKRATRVEAARAVDRTLGRGALVETAAEALAGRHGAFAGLAVSEARQLCAALTPAAVVPFEAPRGLWFGGGAALLLLALALGPASERAPTSDERPILFEAEAPSGPSSSHPGSSPRPSETPNATVVRPAIPGNGTPATSPERLSPETARALAEKIKAMLPRLKPRGGEASEEKRDETAALDALKDAVARGDEAALREVLGTLAEKGTQASAPALEKAASQLESDSKREATPGEHPDPSKGGAGSGTGATPTPALPGLAPVQAGDAGLSTPSGRSARELTSWRVHAAETRYREAPPESRGGS